jgi:hypothetical protein
LDKQSHRGLFLPEEGLESCATLSANRRHFDNTAVRINRHDRYDATIWKKNIIERAIGVHQDLTVLAGNLFELRHQPLEIAGWERKQKSVLRPICWFTHMF